MPTSTDLCNLSLTRLGQASIASLNEPSKEARTCRTLYDRVRRTTLAGHPWGFATAVIVAASVTAEAGWDYAYAKPTGCIRVIEIPAAEGADPIKFEVRGALILTNEPEASVRFIQDIPDLNLWSEQAIEAFSYRLASDLAIPLTGNASYVSVLNQAYFTTLSQAKGSDAKESKVVKTHGRSILDARR